MKSAATRTTAEDKRETDKVEIIEQTVKVWFLLVRESLQPFFCALWFAFIVLYLASYAGNLILEQRAAVFLASMAIACTTVRVFRTIWAIDER